MDETTIAAIELPPMQKLGVLVLGTIAGFAADHFTRKGVTKFLLNRQ